VKFLLSLSFYLYLYTDDRTAGILYLATSLMHCFLSICCLCVFMSYDFQESVRLEGPYHKFQGHCERLIEPKIAHYAKPVSSPEVLCNICISHVGPFCLLIDGEFLQPLGDLQSFENEWLEVEVKHPTGWRQSMPTSPSSELPSSPKVTPKFLCPVLEEMCQEAGEGDQDWRG